MSKQTKLKDPQRINFIGKLENQANGAAMFFIIKKSEETTFKFSQNSVKLLIVNSQKIVDLLTDLTMKIHNLQQKNHMLLIVNQNVFILTKMKLRF